MKPRYSGRWLWWAAALLIVAVGLGLGIGLGTRGEDQSVDDGADLGGTADLAGPSTTISVVETTTLGETDAGDGTEAPASGESSDLEYILAADNLLWLMDDNHRRLLGLTGTIDEALPDVPEEILDELETMADDLVEATEKVEGLEVPIGKESNHHWLLQAAGHMADWVDAFVGGVKAGRSSGSVGAARVYLEEGGQDRDEFEAAMVEYWMCTAPT